MNIYEKLVLARLGIAEKGIKKTGKNEFAKFGYFELEDFLPAITEYEGRLKFCCVTSFGPESAELQIVNIEEPTEVIRVATPMSSADLKGVHAVQNLGAVQTYLRRYLYMAAFEIVERDAIDSLSTRQESSTISPKVTPLPTAKAKTTDEKITADQYRKLCELVMNPDGTKNETEASRLSVIAKEHGYDKIKDILQKDFNKIADEMVKLPFDMEE